MTETLAQFANLDGLAAAVGSFLALVLFSFAKALAQHLRSVQPMKPELPASQGEQVEDVWFAVKDLTRRVGLVEEKLEKLDDTQERIVALLSGDTRRLREETRSRRRREESEVSWRGALPEGVGS